MPKMRISVCEVGPIVTNCYLIQNTDTREIIVVDPGDSAETITRAVLEMEGTVAAVLLTHGHHDHILGLPGLLEKCPSPVYACSDEKEMLSDPKINMSAFEGQNVTAEPDVWLEDNEVISMAGFDIRVIHTPGHTRGSCCYYFKEQNILISGDTLFRGSVGRTDFPGGSMKQMYGSLHRLLEELPDDTMVFPGHGPATTIEFEKRNNPFV